MFIPAIYAPEHPLDLYDAVEVHPIHNIIDGDQTLSERCEPVDADYWSCYLHLITGGIECVADLRTKAQASNHAVTLVAILFDEEVSSRRAKSSEKQSSPIELVAGTRYKITKDGAFVSGWKPLGWNAKTSIKINLKVGDIVQYAGMGYSGGIDGIEVHKFKLMNDAEDSQYTTDFSPYDPSVKSIWDTRPDTSFFEIAIAE